MNTAEKTNLLKPRVFETAAFIASIQSGKSMSACAMNTFKTSFFFLQDKVANIWCSISVLIKVRRVLTQTQIIKLRLVIAFYARDRWMLCQSALWEFIGTLLSLNATSTFPIMHLICSPKFCISIVFNFSWDGCNTQEKWEATWLCRIWAGRGGGGIGALWQICKWRITRLRRKLGKNLSPKTDPQLTFPLFAKSNWVALVLACVAPVI